VRAYLDPIAMNWSSLLSPAEYAYNNARHESTGFSPFELDCGQRPSDPMFMFLAAANQNSTPNRVVNTLEDFMQQQVRLWDTARNALTLAQANAKHDYDKRHIHEEFHVGDLVYMSTKRHLDYGNIYYASKQAASKFEPRYLGPFKVIQKVSTHAYKLELPPSMRIHPVIHIRYLLRPRVALRYPNRMKDQRPDPIIVGEHPEFEVDSILKKRVKKYGRGARVEYLIHWKGYSSEEDTWEPIANLEGAMDMVRSFDAQCIDIEINHLDYTFVL
jgi:hypothetical protein